MPVGGMGSTGTSLLFLFCKFELAMCQSITVCTGDGRGPT